MSVELSKKQIELLEKFGVAQENYGLSPVPARINALLTVAESPELTFDEIRETLQISKSAASNALSTLSQIGLVTYKTKLGDRKRYFYSAVENWKEKFKNDMQNVEEYFKVLNEIIEVRSGSDPTFNDHLKQFSNFLDLYVQQNLTLIEKWDLK